MHALQKTERYSEQKDKIAILIVSCDTYSDLWDTFFTLFWRFWPDCPFRVYLLSNRKEGPDPRVVTINVGEDISWSDNLREGVQWIAEKYILMWIDDLFLLERVNNDALLRVCKKFIEVGGNQIRLNPTTKADAPCNDLFGVASSGTIYRSSTVMSLWRKEILMKILQPGESAWDFEIHGTARSDAFDGFYASWENYFTVINSVIKGKWRRKARKRIGTLLPNNDFGKRSIMTSLEELVLITKVIRSKGLSMMPAKYRREIKDFIVSGRYNYRLADDGKKNIL